MNATTRMVNQPGPSPERQAQLTQLRDILTGFVNKNADSLGYLWGRWLDEREYEDFAEYAKLLEAKVTEFGQGLEFVKATKRPFGVQVTHEFTRYKVAITVTGRGVTWKAVQ